MRYLKLKLHFYKVIIVLVLLFSTVCYSESLIKFNARSESTFYILLFNIFFEKKNLSYDTVQYYIIISRIHTKKIYLSKSFNVRIREQAIKKTILKIESWKIAFDSAVRFSCVIFMAFRPYRFGDTVSFFKGSDAPPLIRLLFTLVFQFELAPNFRYTLLIRHRSEESERGGNRVRGVDPY